LKQRLDILIAADINKTRPWFRDRIPAINQAIEEVSWQCEIVDIYGLLGRHKYMPTNTSDRATFLQTANIQEINKNFENEVILKKPTVLILGTADNFIEFLLPKTIGNIRKSGVVVVGTLGDDEFTYPQYRFLLGWFDLFVAYVKPCVEYYEGFGLSKGHYLPNSCFLNDLMFSEHSKETMFDAILIGSPIANRPEMVKGLIDSGLKVAIYGSEQWTKYDFARDYYFGFVATEMFDEVLKSGKIVLAFLEDHLTGKLHMNTKIWEAVRVARLPVVTYYERLVEDYKLSDGVDIVMYRGTKDLVEKVKYFVENDNERLKVSQRLYNRVKKEFDYALLYKNLFNEVMTQSSCQNDSIEYYDADVRSELRKNNNDVMCFSSTSSTVDSEVLNHIKIIKLLNEKNHNVDFVYFDRVENGLRVISRWPFVSHDSIIFFSKNKAPENRVLRIMEAVRLYFFGRSIHIRQFCVVTDKTTFIGRVNRCIDRVAHGKLGLYVKTIKQNYKLCFDRADRL